LDNPFKAVPATENYVERGPGRKEKSGWYNREEGGERERRNRWKEKEKKEKMGGR
jgi:3-hydroxyacyl-CoA dehydrogenase